MTFQILSISLAVVAFVLAATIPIVAIRSRKKGHEEGRAAGVKEGEVESRVLREKLELETKHAEEKLGMLSDRFKALSSEALKANNESFLQLAQGVLEKQQSLANKDLERRQGSIEELMKPIKQSLEKFDGKIGDLEKARVGAYESLSQQVRSLLETQTSLKSETSNLVKALRSPIVRGRWGEIQLKRVVEMAGMLDHCDFFEQESTQGENGRLRPRPRGSAPGGKNIVVDAKAPLAAYLESIEVVDEQERIQKLKDHARHVKTHMAQLSRKSYWDQFKPAPEFVVLFLPGEIFFSAALEQDPSLIESGVEQRVILATPTTLIALLRAVAYGWRQEHLAENAHKISELGKEMHKRIADLGSHMSRLGKNLNQAVDSYNKTLGTMESRVLVTARKFQELKSDSHVELPESIPVDNVTRAAQAPELQEKKRSSGRSASTVDSTQLSL